MTKIAEEWLCIDDDFAYGRCENQCSYCKEMETKTNNDEV
jgi:hypothetical protein